MYRRILALFAGLLLTAPVLGGCSDQAPRSDPKARAGVIDLSLVQFADDVIRLNGEWEFYWKQLLQPDQLKSGALTGYIDVPGSWNKSTSGQTELSGDGWATYRLTWIAANNERLSLKIPRLHTAYKLWVNKELKAAAGTVGEEKTSSAPQYLPQVVFFEARQGENEIIIWVSNFHQRSGGILEDIKIGSEERILDLRYKNVARELLLFGALTFMGAYHLALFLFRRKDRPPLYFGTFCLLLAMRTVLVGDSFFFYLFPDFSWEIAHKMSTLTYYWGVPLISMFFVSVSPKYFHASISRIAQFMGATFGILVLLTPVRIFSLANPAYQIWTVLLIAYVLAATLRASICEKKDYRLIALGTLALTLTSLNDIAFHSIWRYDYGPEFLKVLFQTGSLSSYGQLVFAFANSLLLAKRFSKSLEREQVMTAELIAVNANLDELVLQRTEALARSNEEIERQKSILQKANEKLRQISLRDPLTGIWNRRKYDETIHIEWNRCLRHQRPIALMLLDIDFFKQFNDAYGHMAGDACLTEIARTINETLSRSTDMVARYGGEEFIVLLPEASREDVVRVANMLWEKIAALGIPHGNSSASDHVTVSVGAACMVPSRGSSHEDLFRTADRALYQAKAGGRNQVRFLSE